MADHTVCTVPWWELKQHRSFLCTRVKPWRWVGCVQLGSLLSIVPDNTISAGHIDMSHLPSWTRFEVRMSCCLSTGDSLSRLSSWVWYCPWWFGGIASCSGKIVTSSYTVHWGLPSRIWNQYPVHHNNTLSREGRSCCLFVASHS